MSKSAKRWLIGLGVLVLMIWGLVSGLKFIFKVKAPYRYQEEGRLIERDSVVVKLSPTPQTPADRKLG